LVARREGRPGAAVGRQHRGQDLHERTDRPLREGDRTTSTDARTSLRAITPSGVIQQCGCPGDGGKQMQKGSCPGMKVETGKKGSCEKEEGWQKNDVSMVALGCRTPGSPGRGGAVVVQLVLSAEAGVVGTVRPGRRAVGWGRFVLGRGGRGEWPGTTDCSPGPTPLINLILSSHQPPRDLALNE